MLGLELGTKVSDRATGLTGMLTHLQVGTDNSVYYSFQPKGLNPEDGLPVKQMWILEDRIVGAKECEHCLPERMLGTFVVDKASGFKGIVTHLTLHINGCIHALVQAKGCLKKTGAPIDPYDIDVRRLEGKYVPEFSNKEEKKENEKKFPSPVGCKPYSPRI